MIFNAEQMYKKRNTAKDSNWSINSILSYKMEIFLFLFIFLIQIFLNNFDGIGDNIAQSSNKCSFFRAIDGVFDGFYFFGDNFVGLLGGIPHALEE